MKTRMAMAALAVALLSLVPAIEASAGDHRRHGRDRHHHHHHHYDRGYERGPRYYDYRYYRPPPPPPVHYYYYAPPPRPPATVIYRDYGYGPSLVLDVEIGRRR